MKTLNWMNQAGSKAKFAVVAVLLNFCAFAPSMANAQSCTLRGNSGSCSSNPVSGTVNISADSGYDIELDGGYVGLGSYSWDTTASNNGNHTIRECANQSHTTTTCTEVWVPDEVFVHDYQQVWVPDMVWVSDWEWVSDEECVDYDENGDCTDYEDQGSYVDEGYYEDDGYYETEDNGYYVDQGYYDNQCTDQTTYKYECNSDYTVTVSNNISSTQSCSIVGGQGAQLFGPAPLNKPDCQQKCSDTYALHPNEFCNWGPTDLAPQGLCKIVGGQGGVLSNGTQTRGQCVASGQNLFPVHPNLTMFWSGLDVTPTGECVIVGSDGTKLFDQINTHYQCYTACGANQSHSPRCDWGFKNTYLAYP